MFVRLIIGIKSLNHNVQMSKNDIHIHGYIIIQHHGGKLGNCAL